MPPKRTVTAESSRPTKRKQTSKVQVPSSSTQSLGTNPASVARSIEESVAQSYSIVQQRFNQQLLNEVNKGPSTSGSTSPAERDGVELEGFNESVGTVVKKHAFESVRNFDQLEYTEQTSVM